jgi:hypothetical protein
MWLPFKMVSDNLDLHSRWLLLLKIEISLIALHELCQLPSETEKVVF